MCKGYCYHCLKPIDETQVTQFEGFCDEWCLTYGTKTPIFIVTLTKKKNEKVRYKFFEQENANGLVEFYKSMGYKPKLTVQHA